MKKTLLIAILALVAQMSFAQNLPSYLPTNGLVGYWPFNGNANDESGNGNNGTVSGATLTTDRNGNANSAYSFSGSNISVPITENLHNLPTRTFSCWFYADGEQSGGRIYETTYFNGGIGLYNGNILDAWYSNGGNEFNVVNINTGTLNQWHNLVYISYGNTNEGVIYLDGIFNSSRTGTPNNSPSNWQGQYMRFGLGASGEIFNGKIDDIGIWNRALTQAEITQLYTAAPTEVTIGTQTWTTKNLDVATYSDGTIIPQVTDPTEWANLTTGAWCYYNNDPTNGSTYGKLYNWYAVAGIHDNDPNTPNKKLAPTGYHVPSDAEWTTLTDYLGGESVAGGKIKSITLWDSPNIGASNSSGFTSIPGGVRYPNGTFQFQGYSSNFWTSTLNNTNAFFRNNVSVNGSVYGANDGTLNCALSVRCVKDEINPDDAFITTWVTDVANETLTLPAQVDAPNYTIDWGDGSATNTYTATQAPSHTYSNSGEHTISFTGTFPHLTFGVLFKSNAKLKVVQQWGTQKWTSMENMFFNCTILNSFPSQAPDLSLCSNMSTMFYNAFAFNQPIGSWDVSNVTNMRGMFAYALAFNQPIGSWDVSNVTNMRGMFNTASAFNQPIGSWNVSNVTDMYIMFTNATDFNQPLGSWNVSNVTYMGGMFANTAFNQPIGSWNVSNVINMSAMFVNAFAFNQPLGSWDVSSVTEMYHMFRGAAAFNQPIGSWDVSNVTDMYAMFSNAKLSTANYDDLLGGWASKGVLQKKVRFSGGSSDFCNNLISRDKLIKTYGWDITDGWVNCTGEILPNPPQVTNWLIVTNTSVSVGATGVTPTATAVAEYPLQWYTVATKGTASTTAPTVATTTAGVKSYWVSQKYGAGTESPRALVTVTVVALPATPSSLSLFDGATGVTSLGSYVGSSSVLKLSTIAVANATYKWTLPVGVFRTDAAGNPINDTSSTDAFINVKFSPTTLTTALVVGVQLVNNVGGISKTTKTLSLARKVPSTLTGLALTTNDIVGSITKVGPYMGVDKDFTLTATAVTTQGVRPVSYKWVLPAGVTASGNATLVSIGVYTSTLPSITINFKGVTTPAITSLPINAYAVNGVGTSAAKVLTLTRALPKMVSSVTGSALVCNRTTGFNYTILASDGATKYLITAPTNSVVSSASNTTNTTNTLTTSDLSFNVVYTGTVTVSTKQTLTIKSMNGAGTASAKSIALTKQVSCTTLDGISKVTPVAEAFTVVAYPNPTTSVFTLDVNLAKGTSAGVQVYDMAGRLIEKLQIKSGPTQLGANYPSGTYILKVSQGKNLKSLQVIKR